jgi:hypothetical protein
MVIITRSFAYQFQSLAAESRSPTLGSSDHWRDPYFEFIWTGLDATTENT